MQKAADVDVAKKGNGSVDQTRQRAEALMN
jgi:hypothetical protein